MHASARLTPFFVNSAQQLQVSNLLAVGRPTTSRGSILGGDEGGQHRSSAVHGILSANVVTRSKAEAAVLTPRGVASSLAQWTVHTLTDTSSSMRSSTANYAPIESARPIKDMAVSGFILQRQAITQFARDPLESAVYKQKEKADKHCRKNMSNSRRRSYIIIDRRPTKSISHQSRREQTRAALHWTLSRIQGDR